MKGKIGAIIAIAIGIIVAVGFFSPSENQPEEKEENTVFHVTLADPENYENGVYTDSFRIEEGTYQFRFVPNGDSPQSLTITLNGESVKYVENFTLEGTAHETGISTYYTWEYSGNYLILIPEDQIVEIVINPNGNLQGPVTVDIL